MTENIEFRWLGVAGIELNISGQILAIDPLFTRPPLHRLLAGRVEPDTRMAREKMPHCDHILVSHAHWDHLMDVPALAKQTGAAVYGSFNACKLLSICDVPEKQINEVVAGSKLQLGKIKISVFNAEHLKIPGFNSQPVSAHLKSPLRLRDYHMDHCYSFLIEIEQFSVLDWCGLLPDSAPQATVLCVGFFRNIAFFETLLERVKPRLMIPLHWDNLFRPLSKPLQPFVKSPLGIFPSLQLMNPGKLNQVVHRIAPAVKVLSPEIFRTYDLHLLSK